MFVVSVYDESHQHLLLFGDFNLFLDLKSKQNLDVFSLAELDYLSQEISCLPWIVWWWR